MNGTEHYGLRLMVDRMAAAFRNESDRATRLIRHPGSRTELALAFSSGPRREPISSGKFNNAPPG